MNEMLDAALDYAEQGFSVFPVVARGKRPLTRNGFKDASRDADQIARWWALYPNANIGIATGSRSGGLVVIDVDLDAEKGKNGYDTLQEWKMIHGGLPDTAQAVTGRGGLHLYFKSLHGYKCSANESLNIDIRAEGGYVLAPPSIHENGNAYKWVTDKNHIAEVDVNVNSFLRYVQQGNKKQEETKNAPGMIMEGSRVNALVAMIGSLKAKGLSNDAIRAAVYAENNTRCFPPLSSREMEKEVLTALTRGWKTEDPYYEAVPELKPALSSKDLQALELPPINWIIKDLLPEGLAVLAAPPKTYKSFMAIDLGLSISRGLPFLGFQTTKCGVLYYDLESSKRRPKDRIEKILHGEQAPEQFYIVTQDDDPGRLGSGFLENIKYQVEQYPDIRLIIIDVYQKIREPTKNKNFYEKDYEDGVRLQSFALQHNICIMVLHHTSKKDFSDDPFNSMSGSTGLLGSADTGFVIKRDKRFKKEAKLSITGREIRPQELVIKFNEASFRWDLCGTVEDVEANKRLDEYKSSPIIATVKKLLSQSSDDPKEWTGTISEIISASKYFNTHIYDKPQQVGTKIRDFEMFLALDGISVETKRTGQKGKREIRFFENGWDCLEK